MNIWRLVLRLRTSDGPASSARMIYLCIYLAGQWESLCYSYCSLSWTPNRDKSNQWKINVHTNCIKHERILQINISCPYISQFVINLNVEKVNLINYDHSNMWPYKKEWSKWGKLHVHTHNNLGKWYHTSKGIFPQEHVTTHMDINLQDSLAFYTHWFSSDCYVYGQVSQIVEIFSLAQNVCLVSIISIIIIQ